MVGIERDDDRAFAAPTLQLDTLSNEPSQQAATGATQVFVLAGPLWARRNDAIHR
jgi:hypothetical protein